MSRAIGLGCMRLSTEPTRPDEATSRAIIDAAIAAGITLVDTADVYCHSDADLGHNERLLANLPAHVRVVTKGGLTRPDGAWVPNGRAKHLASAARASLSRLGRIDLYLLHVIDPKVPLATSVRALARLLDDKVVPAIGLSNVNLTQLESALSIAPIAAVEIELHPYKLDALRGGLLDACTTRGIEVLAYRPFGGRRGLPRLTRDPIVREHATRLACTPAELTLAWLRSLSPMVVPLPGASRMETALSAAHVIELDAEAKHALDESFLTIGKRGPSPFTDAREKRGPSPLTDARGNDEVVLVMGIPGAGKSSLARDLVQRGYARLNRDDRGGSLLELARALDEALASGTKRVVLDNTYPSRASRRPVIDIARRHGLAVRCIVVDTPIERAQHNAVVRMLDKHGRMLEPAELRGTDIGPGAQFRWRREYEPPREDEGFDEIAIVPFSAIHDARSAHDRRESADAPSMDDRRAAADAPSMNDRRTSTDARSAHDRREVADAPSMDDHRASADVRSAHDRRESADAPSTDHRRAAADARSAHRGRAILVELDDVVWRGRPRTVEKVALHDGVRDALRAWHAAGYAIAATSWQPGVTPARFAELVARLGEMLDVSLRVMACFHAAGPPVCWCRKPLPGLALALARQHRLAFEVCVGSGAADRGFASRAGIRYVDARDGWPGPDS